MKLRERIYQQDLHYKKANRLSPQFDLVGTGEYSHNGYTDQIGYRVTLGISTNFFANQAEYQHARENAEKALVYAMLGDYQQMVREALIHVYNDERDEALATLNHLIEEMSP